MSGDVPVKLYVEIDTNDPEFLAIFSRVIREQIEPAVKCPTTADEVDHPCLTPAVADNALFHRKPVHDILAAGKLAPDAYYELLRQARIAAEQRGIAWNTRTRLERILDELDLPDSWYRAVFSTTTMEPILKSYAQAAPTDVKAGGW